MQNALEWAGVEYDTVTASFGDDLLYELNPIGTVGILGRGPGQKPLSQTPATLQYLARSFPETQIGSDGSPDNAAEYDQWLNFLVSDVHHAFHLLFIPDRYSITDKGAARDAALALCYRNFKVLEAHLADRPYMMGDQKSIIDAYVFPMTRWSLMQFPPDAPMFPNLAALHDRMRADPKVEKAMRNEGIWELALAS